MENILNHRLLTWIAAQSVLCAEASEIGLPAGQAPAAEITVVGRHDAVTYRYVGAEVVNEGEIRSWEYAPTAASLVDCPAAHGTRLVIFND